MFFSRRSISACLLVLGLFLTLTGCSSPKATPEAAPIKVGMMPITDNSPFWVAEQQGYFKDEGIQVELVSFPSAIERDSAFAAGQIDAGIGDLLAVAAMNNSGTKVKAVSVGQGAVPGENRFAILSAPNSGITKPGQLANVPIALSLNTINEYITDNLLTAEGLKTGEIKTTNMVKLPIRFEALINGSVKAATLPDPFATLAEIKGAHLILDNSKNTVAQTVVIVRKETLDTNLEGVKKLMRAYDRAVKDLSADPQKYEQLVAEKAKIPSEVMSSKEHLLQLHFSEPQAPDKAGVEKTISWMKDHGLLQKDFQYSDLVDERIIQK